MVDPRRLRAGGPLWDAVCRRVLGSPLDDAGTGPRTRCRAASASRLALELFASEAPALLLDEPDNFLDIPGKRWLEDTIKASRKTVLVISHDRELLSAACDSIVTLEGDGARVHGGLPGLSRRREHRQQLMADRVTLARGGAPPVQPDEDVQGAREVRQRLGQEGRRHGDALAPLRHRGASAQAPVVDRQIRPRLRGGDSARRAVILEGLTIPGLVRRADDEVRYGERVGLIGPNGTGKSHLMRLLAGEAIEHDGTARLGPRVTLGLFTQHIRPEFEELNTVLDVMTRLTSSNLERAMNGWPATTSRTPRRACARRCPAASAPGWRSSASSRSGPQPAAARRLHRQPRTSRRPRRSRRPSRGSRARCSPSPTTAASRRLDRFLLLDADGHSSSIPDAGRALEASADAVAAGAR